MTLSVCRDIAGTRGSMMHCLLCASTGYSSLLRYRSPPSGNMTTTTPWSSFSAAFSAAESAAPDDVPTNSPSSLARRFVISKAASVPTESRWSGNPLSKMPGTMAPSSRYFVPSMPCMASSGCTERILMSFRNARSALPVPMMVPPVPTQAMKCVTLPPVPVMTSGPVPSSWAFGLEGLLYWSG